MRGERKIWPALLLLPILVLAVLTAGLALPLPYIDIVAALLSGLFVYLLPGAIVIALLAHRVWRARRTGFRLTLLLLAAAGHGDLNLLAGLLPQPGGDDHRLVDVVGQEQVWRDVGGAVVELSDERGEQPLLSTTDSRKEKPDTIAAYRKRLLIYNRA